MVVLLYTCSQQCNLGQARKGQAMQQQTLAYLMLLLDHSFGEIGQAMSGLHSVVVWTQSPGITAQSPGSTATSQGSMAQSPGSTAQSPGSTAQSQSRQQNFGGFRAQADRMGRALCCAAEVPISFRDTKVRHSLHTQRSQKEKEPKNISLCGQSHRATKLTCPSRLVPLAVDSNTCVGDSVD